MAIDLLCATVRGIMNTILRNIVPACGRTWKRTFILSLIAAIPFLTATAQDYTYDVPVALEGIITEQPPVQNLGEPWPEGEKHRKGDNIFVLVLKTPITVTGNPADPISTETETNVSRLQLIGAGQGDVAAWEGMLKRLQKHVKQGDPVVIKGSFLHAHTVHHQTPVLLVYTSFQPATAP